MVGGEEHFSHLEALKCLFQHFFSTFPEKRQRRKIEKGTFHPNLKRGICAPYPSTALADLYIISSCCKVNTITMSIFLFLHCFYLHKLKK